MKNPNSPMPEEAMTDEMSAMPPMPAEGEVMMSIPKSTFDQLHGIVVQLAEAIDALAVNVEQQAAGGGEMMPPETPEGEMEDADLAAFAEELSRGAV
jgi:hypothetical protein